MEHQEETTNSEELEGEPEGFQPTETKDDAEARNDFWLIQGNFTPVHLFVPKEETFPIPLKYIDVPRATNTNLDVLQEKRVDDCWNVDVNRSLSEFWKGFTKFTPWKEEPPK